MAERSNGPSVWLGLPPASLLKFPPGPHPNALPPQAVERSWLQPFNIPPTVYNHLLSPTVPITIALVYATTVVLVNRLNKKRGYKPWAISKTWPFYIFVVLHNIFLAVYSLWTFLGMAHAFRQTWPERSARYGLVNVVDSLCKINGPRGLGNAAIYDTSSNEWTISNPEYALTDNNLPDPTDVGRLWNGGLAYFGWIFYLSKFYEVLDTAIILAKGKKSSTLQTYHHAGAMMCMWAGIRYMAAPIWIFALFNSIIHAMMYTYYTLTALSVRIPVRIKRSLTTMQILQFIIGTLLAASHLFVYYSLPVTVPHISPVASVASGLVQAGNNSAGVGPWLKKMALRAAGAEGSAENVVNSKGSLFGTDGANAAHAIMDKEMSYSTVSKTFTCMDTSGQAFAIWLNVLYLLPLTYLFARFFVRSYLRRTEPGSKHPTHLHVAEKAGMDALKGVTREITNAVIEMHGDGTVSEDTSGTNTPHPEAYEANVESIMNRKQLHVQRALSKIDAHPHGPKFASGKTTTGSKDKQTTSKSTTRSSRTQATGGNEQESTMAPLGERGYEANIQEIMSSSEKLMDANPKTSSEAGQTPPIEGYEANFEKILSKREKKAQKKMQPATTK
ncbi:hypothetical protein FQN57_000173 [Myotisia sp. PD_48]|nr:hypothetical protein FQN57_000173 [Myotisia sp. PD_48]